MEIQKYKVLIPLFCINPDYAKRKIGVSRPIIFHDNKYNIGILDKQYDYDEILDFTGKAIEIEESPNIL